MHKKTAKKIKQLKKKLKGSVFYCGLHGTIHNKTLIFLVYVTIIVSSNNNNWYYFYSNIFS